jgi:hypothetical protein
MEEGTLAASTFLTWLILPISAVAWLVGFFTTVKGLRSRLGPDIGEVIIVGRDADGSERRGSVPERVAAGLCVTLSVTLPLLLAVAAVRAGARAGDWVGILLLIAIFFVLAAPAALWNTRYRMAGEGIATMALATIAPVAGFIGLLFLPVVVLMIWVCIGKLRVSRRHRETITPSG